MGRAERRRAQKLKQKEKTTTYNLTKAQLDVMVREKIGDELIRVKQEATDDAVNTAMVLLLTLPLEVLMGPLLDKILCEENSEVHRTSSGILRTLAKW